MWIVHLDLFLIKKLLKSDIYGSVNNVRMYYSRLKSQHLWLLWLLFMNSNCKSLETRAKKKSKMWTWDVRRERGSKPPLRLGLDCDKKQQNVRLLFFCGSFILFMGPTSTDFSKIFFKTVSHNTIHTFKNYFVTIFLIFSNKRYPNRLNVCLG